MIYSFTFIFTIQYEYDLAAAPPHISYLFCPYPALLRYIVLHNCEDSCQDPAGSRDALSPYIFCGDMLGYMRGTH